MGRSHIAKGFRFLRRAINRAVWALIRPQPRESPHKDLAHLGTPYGGWYFVNLPSLRSANVLSAGLGEDASFDLAMAQIYGAKVLMIDPTDRAEQHFKGIQSRKIEIPNEPFSAGGVQPIGSYNLGGVSLANLLFRKAALWVTSGTVTIFPPTDLAHVSWSITDYQNFRKKKSNGSEVNAVTYGAICQEFFEGVAPELVKLDIEGAEVAVIQDILFNPPRQLLVEFDELSLRDFRAVRDWRKVHGQILSSGFSLVHWQDTNFTYLRTKGA